MPNLRGNPPLEPRRGLRERRGMENLRVAGGFAPPSPPPSRPGNPGPYHANQFPPAPASPPPGSILPAPIGAHAESPAGPAPASPVYSLTQSPDPGLMGYRAESPSPTADMAGHGSMLPFAHPGDDGRATRRYASPPPPPLSASPVSSTASLAPAPSLGHSAGSGQGSAPGTPTGGNYTYENRHFQAAWLTHRNLAGMGEPPRVHSPGRAPSDASSRGSGPDGYAFSPPETPPPPTP